MRTTQASLSGIVQLLIMSRVILAASTLLSRSPSHLEHDEPAKAVRHKQQWAKWIILIDLAVMQHPQKTVCTFLFCFKFISNRSATEDTLCCIISSPNHCDWYPYRMMRAFGATAGNMLSSSSQLTRSQDNLLIFESLSLHIHEAQAAPLLSPHS
jgi:hypothetical protein